MQTYASTQYLHPLKSDSMLRVLDALPFHLRSHFQVTKSAEVDKTNRFMDFDARRDHYDNEI